MVNGSVILSWVCKRIQEFSSGGVHVSLTKKALTMFFFFCFFLSPLQKSNCQFQRNLSFFKVPEGVQHFPGRVQLFPGGGGGGSSCLFPIETHITRDFQGGVRNPCPPAPPPPPPPGSALDSDVFVALK